MLTICRAEKMLATLVLDNWRHRVFNPACRLAGL
jgi:hypothetical protein